MTATATKKARFKFRLLYGHHTVNVGNDEKYELKTYRQGDEFESDIELDKRFNSRGSVKFERLEFIPEDTEELLEEEERRLAERRAKLKAKRENEEPVQEVARRGFEGYDELAGMNVKQLRQYAEERGIDLGLAKTQERIVQIIRENLVEA